MNPKLIDLAKRLVVVAENLVELRRQEQAERAREQAHRDEMLTQALKAMGSMLDKLYPPSSSTAPS